MEILTYDALSDAWRNQKTQKSLVKLSPDFYRMSAQYVDSIRSTLAELEGKTDEFTLKRFVLKKEELNNATSRLRDVCVLRCGLILSMVWESVTRGVPVSFVFFTPEERVLFDAARRMAEEQWAAFSRIFSDSACEKRVETVKKEVPSDRLKVTIKTALPAFAGTDLNTYGPYDGGEVVELPRKVAEMLARAGKAESGE